MNIVDITLTVLIFATALLYSSVGHAGASGYLAAMALLGIAPAVMKPTALALNILVAAIAGVQFYRAGRFSWPLFWPFAVTSIPFAFLGGRLSLSAFHYKILVGLVLLYAAFRLLQSKPSAAVEQTRALPIWVGIVCGSGIGLLSGLTGVGGGIFLSPLLLLMGWAGIRETSGVAAVFILVNSVAGLAGHLSSLAYLPPALPFWAVAAAAGGSIGARCGSRGSATHILRRLLGAVLVIAAVKMMLT